MRGLRTVLHLLLEGADHQRVYRTLLVVRLGRYANMQNGYKKPECRTFGID